LLYFDQETTEQKELRYATNHTSPFVQEQKGEATLGHIIFQDGVLTVPKEKQNLQKLLSLYHPALNRKYYEFDSVEIAEDELDDLEIQIDALNAARTMDIDQAEAIMRVELGSKVSTMSSKELKRDLLLFAKKNPYLFMELANDDNVHLRNIAIRATELGILRLSPDQRSFHWGSNDRNLMNVPFDENPYSAMAAWFKTDEGVEVYRNIEKNLK
jgi:frataxin-like iron-binding protein CyaY